MNIVYLCMLVQCALVAAAEKVQLVPPVPPTATPQAKIQTTPVSTVITDEIKEDEETASLRTLLALDEKEAAEGDARAAEEVALAREKIIEESALELSVPQQKEEKKTVLQPWKAHDQELLEFEFDNADLTTFITYIEKHFGIQFITDEALNPPSPQAKKLTGTKITFRTHQPLTKKEVWDLFLAFLDIAGVAPQVGPSERIIKLSSTDPRSPASVYRGPIPTYIGTDPALLPDNDMRIRYIYFVENTSLDVMKGVIDTWKGGTSPALVIFPDLKAIVMTDKAVNIKQNLEILKELDRVNQPEAMVVLRLRKMDASKAAELYKSLSRDEGSAGTLSTRLLGGKKPQTAAYFEEGTRVAVDPRTNSLFLFGSRGALKKIEHFIRKLDEGKERPYSPLYVYKLKYVAAETIANILKEAVQFQTESEAAKYGGVRDGDKYFKALSVTPEKSGNRLIINAEYEDYLKIYKLLEDIDIEQPQAAIKVLVLDVEIADDRELGVQMRRKIPGIEGLVGPNVTYQNSGLAGNSTTVVENPNGSGATRLLGDLVNLALSTTNPGSTFITLGADAFGVWGLLQILQTYQKISLVANPFIVVQHKYPAVVGSGTTRRILTGTALTATGSVNSFDDLTARLEVYVEPQISYEGYVT
jgi:type II secretory pathway component GspD/PulD (secretin)